MLSAWILQIKILFNKLPLSYHKNFFNTRWTLHNFVCGNAVFILKSFYFSIGKNHEVKRSTSASNVDDCFQNLADH